MSHPLPTIDDVYRVTLNYELGAKQAHNIIHFYNPGGSESALGDAIEDHLTDSMFSQSPTTMTLQDIDIIKLDGSSATVHKSLTPTHSGGGAGSAIWQLCQTVTFHTAQRGPRGRGRIYLPWVTEGETANGENADIGATQTAWENFQSAMEGDTDAALPTLVVASYKHLDHHHVTGIVARLRASTQRRRQNL